MTYIRLLDTQKIYNDKGYVKLFDVSKCNSNEEARAELVTTVAVTSYDKEKPRSKNKLYEKLLKEKNTTLEFVRYYPNYDISSSLRNRPHNEYTTDCYDIHNKNVACFKFRAPLMVIAHLVRHRSFSYNQCSRRYTKVTIKDIHIPNAFTDNKLFFDHLQNSFKLYNQYLESGIKREITRSVLPAYLIMSDMWIVGDKKAWKSLFNTRLSVDEKTQSETADLITTFKKLIIKNQPSVLL